MTYPNLIIAGAPKCGTSSLFRWVADHPLACGSSVKETFYLMDEDHPLRRPESNYHEHGLAGYRRFFAHCPAGSSVIFEATTHYIYQQTALEALSRLDPLPQIVFVLREPSERVYSSYQYTRNNLANLNREISFSRFVEMVRGDNDGGALLDAHARASAYVLKNDIKYSRYVEYIAPWVERFGRERVHVLLFEEMKRDPRAFMRQFAGRVGLAPDFYDTYTFPVKNETLNIKRQRLHRRARAFEGLLPAGALKEFVKGAYLKMQAGRGRGRELSADDKRTLDELEREFRPFNQRLAEELNLDLSSWGRRNG
jgi:hypothetical protein